MSTRFWGEPVSIVPPLATIERKIVAYMGANALLRLWLEDQDRLDREWATHEGRWVPHCVEAEADDTDVVSVSEAARRLDVHRETLYAALRIGQCPRVEGPRTQVRMADARVWDRQRPRRIGGIR